MVSAAWGSEALTTPTDITVSVESGTAVEGTDFEVVADFTLTLPANETSAQTTFELVPVDDSVDEGSGETLRITGTTTTLPVGGTVLTISDNDTAASTLTLSVSPSEVAEDAVGPARTVTVTAALDGSASNQATAVTLSVAGVTATPVEDFEEIADVTLTIPAGATSGQATFDLLTVDDAIDERDETLRLTGTAPGLEVEPAAGLELTITDNDDTPTVSLSLTPETIREDLGRSRVTATLDHPSNERTTLSVSTTPVAPAAARDIAQAGTTLTILPGETRSSGSVLIEALDNAMPDDDKRFTVSATAENALGVVAPSDRTLAVSDDESPSTSVILEVSRGFIMEGATGASATLTVTATLDGAPRGADTAVTISVGSGTAVERDDFETVSDFVLTIPAGAMSGEASFTLAPVDDDVDEADESVLVTGTGPGVAVSPMRGLRVTIVDDDERGVTVTPTALTVLEGGSGSYRVVLGSQPTGAVTVEVSSSHPDVTVSRNALTFTASNWSTAQAVGVNAADDQEVDEDVVARLTHEVRGGDYGAHDVEADAVRVTVPGLEIEGMAAQIRVPASGEVTVPPGTPVPAGTTLSLPAGLVGEVVTITAIEDDPALSTPPRGFGTGDPVVDIALGGGLALGAGQTATVCLPVEEQGWRSVYRYDDSSTPPEWVELEEPAAGSPEGLACGETDRFSLFALGSSPNELVVTSWLARMGRAVAHHVLDAVQERIAASRNAGFAGMLAGRNLAGSGGPVDLERLSRIDAQSPAGSTGAGAGGLAHNTLDTEPLSPDMDELAGNSVFALTGTFEGGRSLALWGRGARSRFEGREDEATVDGDVTTATFGADWASGRLTAGLALPHSRGDGAWTQDGRRDEIESTLTGIHPYFGYEVSEQISVWGLAEHGRGELTMPDGRRTIETDIDMTMAAAGARSALVRSASSAGLDLDLEVDGMFLAIGADETRGLDTVEANVSRVRLGLEGSRTLRFGEGRALTPRLEFGFRHEGGDADTGAGLDVGGGIRYSDAERGLSTDLGVRGLLVHQAAGFEDWGFSGAITLDPNRASDRGLAVSLRHSAGAPASGSAQALFGHETLSGLTEGTGLGDRFEAEVAYGMPVPGGRFVGTPHAGFGLSGNGRDYMLGWRFTPLRRGELDFSLNLDATLREERDGESTPGVGLRLEMRW